MDTKKLKVMVWNLENFFIFMEKFQGQDLELMDEFTWQHLPGGILPNKNLTNVLKVKKIIDKYRPDVLMLTEVGGRVSLENFTKYFLSNEYQVFHKDSNSDRGIDLGYLVKKKWCERSKLKSFKNYKLNFLYPHEIKTQGPATKENSHKFSRDVLYLSLKSHHRNLAFLLVHLKSKLDKNNIDPMGYLRREAECKALMEIYNKIKNDHQIVFVGGDFNGFAQKNEPDVEFKQIYEKSDLIDVLEFSQIEQVERFTHIHEKISGKIYATQLDYLFIPENKSHYLKSVQIDYFVDFMNIPPTPENFRAKRNLLPSDHFPIVAEFAIPSK